jgi:hypothetical protein
VTPWVPRLAPGFVARNSLSSSEVDARDALSVQTTPIAAKFLLPGVIGVAQIGDQEIVLG